MFVLIGILSFLTVMLGGYVREASRPRFTAPDGQRVAGMNRISAYDDVYVPPERQKNLSLNMLTTQPAYVATMPTAPLPASLPAADVPDLITRNCTGCHTLERMRKYRHDDWGRVVRRMVIYGSKLSVDEEQKMVKYLKAGKPY